MKAPISALAIGLILSSGWISVVAQSISTDRPGFIASPIVVPVRTLQVEAGATVESWSDIAAGNTDYLTVGEALIRFGLLKKLEARLELPSYNRVTFGGGLDIPSVDGVGDARLGVKYQIEPLDGAASFDLAAVGMISVPTGTNSFTSDEVEPEVALAAGKILGENLSLGGQISAALPSTRDGRTFEWSLSVGSLTALGPVGVFIECRVDFPDEGSKPVFIHTGFVLPVGPRFQLDVHGAMGVSDAAPDSFIGAGLAAAI